MKSVSPSRSRSRARGGNRAHPPGSKSRHSSSETEELVYETAPLAYVNFDGEGRLLEFNVAAARLLRASRKRDLHRPIANFINPRHHRRLAKHIQRTLTSGVPVVTRLRLLAADHTGQGTEVEVTTRPLSHGSLYRTLLLPISGEKPVPWPADDAKFRALVENGSEVICIGAPDGTVFYTTPSVQRVLGYDPASWYGRNAFEIMAPEHAELARKAISELAISPTGTVLRLITKVRHLDGSWRWVEGVLTNLIAQPAVGGIVCNYRDITDSRRAEEALRASEQQYRLLAESFPQMISISDAQGNIEYGNSHWREYRGVPNVAPLVHDWRQGISTEDAAALMRPAGIGEGRPWEAECRIRRASDGVFRWHTVRIVPLPRKPDAPEKWLAIATDIDERKRAEQERERLLHQLERERSELAVQYAVVRVLGESSGLAEAAPALLAAFCNQLGWQAGIVWAIAKSKGRGSTGPVLTLVDAREQPGLGREGALRNSIEGPLKKAQGLAGRVWKEKRPLRAPHLSAHRGSAHHRAAAALGMRTAFAFPIMLAGEAHGIVELFAPEDVQPGRRLLDIVDSVGAQIGQFMERTHALTRLCESEEALIEANNALEKRVRERTAELHEANTELSAEIVERARLEREIIRVSEREQRRIGQDLHDGVCQELAAIAFMARALGNRMSQGGEVEPERINQVAQLVNDSISRCRDIARGLHPVEMDADGLMVALEDLARRTDRIIPCLFQCNEPVLTPESDTALNLYRIAQEAVNNAMKYSGAGRITIRLDREGAALRLSIWDDGSGIRPARRPRKRAGMGLHIMRYRARAMGATLRVRNHVPHGTEVVCLLPRK
jgi:PAS domain S-box-containing protein